MSEAGGSADASFSCKWCTSYRRFFHELPSADIRASECSAQQTDRALPNQITKELLLGYFPEQFNSRAALNDLVFDDIQARLRIQVLKPVCDACSANSVLKRLCELLDPRAGCDGDGQTPCKQTGRGKEMLFDDALKLVSAGPCGGPPIEQSRNLRPCPVLPGGKRLDQPEGADRESCLSGGVSNGGKRLDPPAGSD